MAFTWNQAVSPPSNNANVNAITNASGITYNYEVPFQNYVNFTFDASQATGAATNAQTMTSLQQQCVRNALSYVHSVTGINFNETAGGPSATTELVFCYADGTGVDANGNNLQEGVFTEYPVNSTNSNNQITALDIKNTIAFSTQYGYMSNLQSGSAGYEALLQGIGQALGLVVPVAGLLPSNLDNDGTTLMSSNLSGNNYTSYQPLDLQALNWLYGGDGLLGTYGLTLDAGGTPKAGGYNPLISNTSAS